MNSYLNQILNHARTRIAAMKATLGPNDEARLVADRPDTPRGFTAALSASTGKTQVIAEIKRASPSRGVIKADIEPDALAHEYELGGATCLSVLTEPDFFRGSVEDLRVAREAVKIPVLRKDFIIDPYQVPRSYGAGADAILVIIRSVPDDTVLRRIFDAAEELHLDVLTEVYDEADAERAVRIGRDSPGALRLVGINCRDLETFRTDISRSAQIAPILPESSILVSLSGVKSRADVKAVQEACPRITRFLIGETLMRATYPAHKLAEILGKV